MEMNFKSLVPALCIGGLIAASAMSRGPWSLQAAQTPDASSANRVLQGTIDIHVHSAPDNVPRSIDGLDVAKLARTRGMKEAVRANVRASANHLRHGSELLERLIQQGGLRVVGAEYSLDTGIVTFFDGIEDVT